MPILLKQIQHQVRRYNYSNILLRTLTKSGGFLLSLYLYFMRDLIKKVLKEQIDNTIQQNVDEIVSDVEQTFPNINVTYKFKSEDKIQFIIDTKDNSANGVMYNEVRYFIWDKTNSNPNITVWINPSKNLIQKYLTSDYIRNLETFLEENNLDPNKFFLTFDGKKTPELDKIIETKKSLDSNNVENKVFQVIQSKTDVPLDITFDTNNPYVFGIHIYPKLTLDDFVNCRYSRWFIDPDNPPPLDIELLWLVKSFESLKHVERVVYDITWPREIGAKIVEKNQELRNLLPNNFNRETSVAIEFGPCINMTTFLIGRSNDGPFNQYRNDRAKVNKIIKQIYPNAKEIITTGHAWSINNMYNPNDTKYWTKEKLFNSFVTQSKEVFGDLYDYNIDRFEDFDSITELYCKQHQRWFEVLPKEHIGGKRCPFDNESKGETMVRVYLEKNNIPFKQYHKLKGCFSEINGRCILLTFDFYLPEQNTVIEYDGEQHYKPVERFGGEPTYQRQVLLDNIKNVFCDKSGVKMIRIPYTIKKPKDIKELLDTQLK